MSATKFTRKWVKTATMEQMLDQANGLLSCIGTERNAMVRSSLMEQRAIVQGEISRRQKPFQDAIDLECEERSAAY